ncbi:MAG: hypothetical protein PUE72_10465 [Lachnospiraceae bacterium]|nr:hypothetical protein [Lachnospiraceae bacterium]
MSEKEIFLAGFYSLSASDQKFLQSLIKDYNAGRITDQEFSERLQERKTTTT